MTASSRTLPRRDWGGGGAEDGEIGANVSSTTVLNWRAHSLEWAVERRATTRLGRMVNDMVTEKSEWARYCVKVDCRGRRPLERSQCCCRAPQWLSRCLVASVASVCLNTAVLGEVGRTVGRGGVGSALISGSNRPYEGPRGHCLSQPEDVGCSNAFVR